jgi:PKHD-type hydroxylase
MLIHIENVLTKESVASLRTALLGAEQAWVDGRVTAGHQGMPVKLNAQVDEHSQLARDCQRVVAAALERNPLFISAALPNTLYPPMFNRYEQGMKFGLHVDGGIRLHPHTGNKIRTDLSATLFLSEPDTYDGGELQIEDTYGTHSAKYAAGDMVLYPSTSLHEVTPVTRGVRLACFTWVQSMIRDDGNRRLLFEMDNAIQRLNATSADEAARRSLVGIYHNLLRKWGEV